MAPFSKYVSFLFFNALLLSLQINARESQFFSKVTHDNNNNFKETELANKEVTVNKPEQEPVFTPETESGYGLYGHESGQFPPATPTTYERESEQETSKYTNKDSHNANTRLTDSSYSSNNDNNNNNYYYNKDSYEENRNEIGNTRLTGHSYRSNNNNNNNYYDSKDANGRNQNEFGNTRLTESSYSSSSNNNNYYYNKDANEVNQNELADTKYTEGEYNFEKNQNNNNYQNYHYTNAANYRKNGERQGMSDTRYVEAGKYYFHVPDSPSGVNTKNWNNYKGYFGNNNANSFENNNMERYQNSEEFEDEEEP
ncbi:hypothetical protein L6164_032889 [Bauhinia variegata]|uniref:Uncharacterized protein n=1 Tax=Bauhinia variegata TaxID=167791 RepID=A0ACB9KQ30_BAUVA|nr:hypothetical protein L6164_032889 [Bauhinia variegata]